MMPKLTALGTKITETVLGLQIEMTLADSQEAEIALNQVQFHVLLDTHEIAAPFVKLQIIALERVQTLLTSR